MMTDANIDLKLMDDIDLDQCRDFVHTPKEGHVPQEDAGYYNKIFSQNEFIQTFMKNVDNKHKTWAAEQSPRVNKVFNNDFLKFATD